MLMHFTVHPHSKLQTPDSESGERTGLTHGNSIPGPSRCLGLPAFKMVKTARPSDLGLNAYEESLLLETSSKWTESGRRKRETISR